MAEAKSMHEHWKDETHTYLRFDYEWQPMYWEAKILPDRYVHVLRLRSMSIV